VVNTMYEWMEFSAHTLIYQHFTQGCEPGHEYEEEVHSFGVGFVAEFD
jgi:hypothetical protein